MVVQVMSLSLPFSLIFGIEISVFNWLLYLAIAKSLDV
jgi:riboflavin transporter FmnP